MRHFFVSRPYPSRFPLSTSGRLSDGFLHEYHFDVPARLGLTATHRLVSGFLLGISSHSSGAWRGKARILTKIAHSETFF